MQRDVAFLLLVGAHATSACTAYAAGKDATTDGSVMVSHSDDGAGASDSRVSFVPAADHAPGSVRPIWPDVEDWPRFVGDARGATYLPADGQAPTAPIGSIPQVAHTYAYLDGNYAVQNECQLSFGESTASAAFGKTAGAVGTPGGKALFSVNELTRVAAERVCSAREAIQLMGSLAEAHGFYGADGGAGEVLMVGDVDEAFVFHILSDPSGTGAIWVAQRVPDDHVAVVANCMTIREVDLDDAHTFLGSSNMHAIAKEHALWDGKGKLSFVDAFSGGEYANQYYTGRRVWDGYRRFSASQKFPASYKDLKKDRPYPATAKVDAKMSVRDWFAAHRSHYEGTPYDTTRGLAAGPFGSPDRYTEPGTAGDPGSGAWERTVGIFRTAATWVAAAKKDAAAGGVAWYAPAASSKSVFMPLMVAAGAAPPPYTVGNPGVLDRSSAYWAHKYVANLAQLRHNAMIVDIVKSQKHWEAAGVALVDTIRSGAEVVRDAAALRTALDAHAAAVLGATWRLADDLMVKYADGGLTTRRPDGSTASVDLGYTKEWLDAVGFADGPTRVGLLPGGATWGEAGLDPNAHGGAAAAAVQVAAQQEPVAAAATRLGGGAQQQAGGGAPVGWLFFAMAIFAGLMFAPELRRLSERVGLSKACADLGAWAGIGRPGIDVPKGWETQREPGASGGEYRAM